MNETTFSSLMTFWAHVEALSPQQPPKVDPGDRSEPVRRWSSDAVPPWGDERFRQRSIPADRMWRHTVYAGLFERGVMIKRLEQRLGRQQDVYEERPDGDACVFAVNVDEGGRPLAETLTLSMAAWAVGVIDLHGLQALDHADACDVTGLHGPESDLGIPPSRSGFPGFDKQLDALREELAWRLAILPRQASLDTAWFNDFVSLVAEKLRLQPLLGSELHHRVKSVQVTRRQQTEADEGRPEKAVDDLLNSFFIKDLKQIAGGGWRTAGAALQSYLEPHPDVRRVDVRRDRPAALALLEPRKWPEGCWPAEHPLVWSQQVAVNALWEDLGDAGCFAVNGPPGTGKTTLLRDVVAAVVVARAKALSDGGPSLLGKKCTLDIGGQRISYHQLAPALSGFSIVVASSNNGAVENVSLELPRAEAVAERWRLEVDVYPDIATRLLGGKPAWGLVAGRLGNRANRSAFAKAFWHGDPHGKVPGLRVRLDRIKSRGAEPTISWDEAKRRFDRALHEEGRLRRQLQDKFQMRQEAERVPGRLREAQGRLAAAVGQRDGLAAGVETLRPRLENARLSTERLGKQLEILAIAKPGLLDWIRSLGRTHREWRAELRTSARQLTESETEYSKLTSEHRTLLDDLAKARAAARKAEDDVKALRASLGRLDSQVAAARQELAQHWPDLGADEADQERSSPWADPRWREARIRVFLEALTLHRAFIESNASKMMANLALAMSALQGRIPDPAARTVAFDSLALACPVVSTTFASASSLFGHMGPGSVGWLLIDEAGQATPQAAAGSIWRARRAVVVGDPFQLEPVVTVPRTVEAALAATHGEVALRWHPSRTSAQGLADTAARYGAMVDSSGRPVWVGAPLRVHRRCDDPMFSISNAVAYDNLMVHGKEPSHSPWPASAWHSVAGETREGNWIPEEGEALEDLLRDLTQRHEVAPREIFLVSPFRAVATRLKAIAPSFGLDRKYVGTVHTAQGKEAKVVILVLGGGTAGARDWAASKPNLLNVAVSRARTRLYVIGHREEWATHRYFDVLNELLVSPPQRESLDGPGLPP